jgi:hypothetical protein
MRPYTTETKVRKHEVAMPLLTAMYSEFKELAKKKPDAPVSKQKIKVVNRLLESCRSVLENEESLVFLDLLDEDDVPQQSDLTLMLSQYVAAMEAFRNQHSEFNGDDYDWFVKKK